ncbi:MAG: hypothetical protein GEU90_13515 [Gemmatimonas sp.]|nr:hypothetical protein [Gemmatimonas sp.]
MTRESQRSPRRTLCVRHRFAGTTVSRPSRTSCAPVGVVQLRRGRDLVVEVGGDLDHAPGVAGRAEQEGLPERLLQGPLADAMTHAGQLALLRRLAGAPVAAENFFQADIGADHLNLNRRNATRAHDRHTTQLNRVVLGGSGQESPAPRWAEDFHTAEIGTLTDPRVMQACRDSAPRESGALRRPDRG